MKREVFKILLSIILLLGLAANSMAEPPEDFDRPPSKEQMEKIRERIETLRMWRLTEAINLDEKSSAKLFPLLKKFDKKRAEVENAQREGMRELRQLLKEKRETQLKGLLERLEKSHKELQKLKEEEWVELKNILTIEQQAKFIIFQQEFDRDIRKIIAEARERKM
ncbi:MAG: hypothetical protein HZC10_04660 [Nitrospirae bacterium]|nr:hypothetical protein [Nitrospirota bacterium]